MRDIPLLNGISRQSGVRHLVIVIDDSLQNLLAAPLTSRQFADALRQVNEIGDRLFRRLQTPLSQPLRRAFIESGTAFVLP